MHVHNSLELGIFNYLILLEPVQLFHKCVDPSHLLLVQIVCNAWPRTTPQDEFMRSQTVGDPRPTGEKHVRHSKVGDLLAVNFRVRDRVWDLGLEVFDKIHSFNPLDPALGCLTLPLLSSDAVTPTNGFDDSIMSIPLQEIVANKLGEPICRCLRRPGPLNKIYQAVLRQVDCALNVQASSTT